MASELPQNRTKISDWILSLKMFEFSNRSYQHSSQHWVFRLPFFNGRSCYKQQFPISNSIFNSPRSINMPPYAAPLFLSPYHSTTPKRNTYILRNRTTSYHQVWTSPLGSTAESVRERMVKIRPCLPFRKLPGKFGGSYKHSSSTKGRLTTRKYTRTGREPGTLKSDQSSQKSISRTR